MTSTKAIERVVTSNPTIEEQPRLEAFSVECLAALESGYELDPALLTEILRSSS